MFEWPRGLIVSCQAEPHSPVYGPAFMAAFAACAEGAGAVGLRVRGAADVAAVRLVTALPVIGLTKRWVRGCEVYLTPGPSDADALAAAGAQVVALDATPRPRPEGVRLADLVRHVREELRLPVMADVSTLDEGLAAADLGADAVSTTLSGYTATSPRQDGPDLALVAVLVARLEVPVLAEGRYHTPELARHAIDAGAMAVVVGTAITEPTAIARRFVAAVGRCRVD